MSLTASPFSSVQLRRRPKRFKTLLGISVAQFDAIYARLYTDELVRQAQRHRLWDRPRVEKLVAGNAVRLREYLAITLLYLRQYNIQEILATSFDLSQGQISKIVSRTTSGLERILPTPERTVAALLACVEQIDPAFRADYSVPLIIDASEQRIERSTTLAQQKTDYSGKKSTTVEKSN